MIKPVRLTTFDLIMICLAVAYAGQFVILTFAQIPTANAGMLGDALKDLSGIVNIIIGAYVRDMVGRNQKEKPNAPSE